MSAIAFDTLKATRELEAAGIEPRQAEAITNTMRDAVVEGVATKSDIAGLESDIASLETKVGSDIASLETKIGSDIASLETKVGSDIASLETKIGSDIARLETKIEKDIAHLETRMLAAIIAVGGIVIARDQAAIARPRRHATADGGAAGIPMTGPFT